MLWGRCSHLALSLDSFILSLVSISPSTYSVMAFRSLASLRLLWFVSPAPAVDPAARSTLPLMSGIQPCMQNFPFPCLSTSSSSSLSACRSGWYVSSTLWLLLWSMQMIPADGGEMNTESGYLFLRLDQGWVCPCLSEVSGHSHVQAILSYLDFLRLIQA